MRTDETPEPAERQRALHAVVAGALLGIFLTAAGRLRAS
jgi:hypothetical protein